MAWADFLFKKFSLVEASSDFSTNRDWKKVYCGVGKRWEYRMTYTSDWINETLGQEENRSMSSS
jgi:hypothetical protein